MVHLAVLIHAETVPPECWEPLARRLAEHGDISVIHAHADWTSPGVTPWLPVARRHGIQLRHEFRARTTQDPALVAVTIDAIELAGAGLDGIVLVGDVGSTLPLLVRLRERGVTVVVAGPPATPMDIRGACAEFVDLQSLDTGPDPRVGRHRA